jgi:D-psicose/D-tagatose/L-ribulose 3-epimerase
MTLPPHADLTSSDVRLRRAGIDLLKVTVKKAADSGSRILTGIIYAPWSAAAGHGATEDELNWSAESLREVARYAQDYGIQLGLEAVNRYESCFINTAEQARKLVDLVGEFNVGIHLDTFHMNIEEKDLAEAVRTAGDKLIHLHVIENDGGIPGTGHLAWDSLFAALAEVRYTGLAGIETFLLLTPRNAKLNRVWRKLAPDGDTLATQGLAFLRGKAERYGLTLGRD